MRITIFANSFEQKDGGISRSVPRLAIALAELGVKVVLVGPLPAATTLENELPSGLRLRFGKGFRNLHAILCEEILVLKSQGGILYHAGVWSYWNHLCSYMAQRHRVPYIVSPRSMLDPWALRYRWFKKKLAWRLYAHDDYNNASAVHVTSALEAVNVRAAGVLAPIFVVSHGIDLPKENLDPYTKRSRKRLLFLSRLHPKKGLEDLINCFARLDPKDWELIVAGNGEKKYGTWLSRRVETLKMGNKITFLGSVAQEEKRHLYFSADAFVLPSYSENFGLVIAEALASELPVITTNVTPWQDLQTKKCGWVISPGQEALLPALKNLFAMETDVLHQMGKLGHEWMASEFRWEMRARSFVSHLRNYLNS